MISPAGLRRAGWARVQLAAVLLATAGCGTSGPATGPAQGKGPLEQGVVASVDGEPIGLAELSRFAAAGRLSPRVALDKLEAEALLAAEAERRGYRELLAVSGVIRQAEVQALLQRDVERVTPSQAEIDAAYAGSGERFNMPEQRASTHVLAVLPSQPTPEQEQAAQRFAEEAVRALQQSGEPVTTLMALQKAQSPLFEIKVETLPAASRQGSFVREFSEALFEVPEPSVVPRAVRTQFGWHAILVTQILPPVRVSPEVAHATLKRELTLSKRRERLAALLRELERSRRVSYDPGVNHALESLEL